MGINVIELTVAGTSHQPTKAEQEKWYLKIIIYILRQEHSNLLLQY